MSETIDNSLTMYEEISLTTKVSRLLCISVNAKEGQILGSLIAPEEAVTVHCNLIVLRSLI